MATKKTARTPILKIGAESAYVGDEITMTVKVKNTGDIALEGGTLTFEKGEVQAGEGYSEASGKVATITKVEPSDTATVTAKYTLQEGDKGSCVLKATFSCDDVNEVGQATITSVTDSVATKVVGTGTWGNTDYSTLGTFNIQGNQITGTAKKVEKEEHFEEDKQSGYYMCLNFEPWEGTQVRIKRSGSWGNWTTCKDNGDILFYLGKEDIEATDIEVKISGGPAVAYTVSVTKEE